MHAHSSSGRTSKQHTAPHCTTLQQNATDRNALQRNATHCTIQYTGVCTLVVGAHEQVTHCNTLHRSTATHFSTLQHTPHHILYKRVSTQYSTCFVREEVAHRFLFLAVINHPPATAATMMCMLPCDCQGNALGSTAPVGRREAYCVGCAEIYTKPTSTRAHPHTHAHCTRCMCTHTVVMTTDHKRLLIHTNTHTRTHMHAHTHAHTYMYTYTYKYTYTYTYTFTYTYTYTYTHVHTYRQRPCVQQDLVCAPSTCLLLPAQKQTHKYKHAPTNPPTHTRTHTLAGPSFEYLVCAPSMCLLCTPEKLQVRSLVTAQQACTHTSVHMHGTCCCSILQQAALPYGNAAPVLRA